MSHQSPNVQNNVAELEKYFRERLLTFNEKKDELFKLKSEVESLSSENYDLKKSVEDLKKTLEENQITTNIFVQKAQDCEYRYQEKRDNLTKIQVQQKMTVAKIDTLREELQNVSIEKAQLLRKLAPLEEKAKLDSILKNDFTTKFNNLKSLVDNINRDISMLKHDQEEAVQKFDNLNLSTELLEKSKRLAQDNKMLKEQNLTIDEAYVKSQAKLEKLEELISPEHINKVNVGLETKILLNKLKKMIEHHDEILQGKNQIINNLSENTQQEKKNNYKLIEENIELKSKNDELTQEIAALKAKLKALNSEKDGEVEEILSLSQDKIKDDKLKSMNIKNEIPEIIEIDDE